MSALPSSSGTFAVSIIIIIITSSSSSVILVILLILLRAPTIHLTLVLRVPIVLFGFIGRDRFGRRHLDVATGLADLLGPDSAPR